MNTREINKIKVIRAFNPNVDPEFLEKYSCVSCYNLKCRARGGFYSRFSGREYADMTQVIRFAQQETKERGRIIEIYTCFEGRPEDIDKPKSM